MELSSLSKIQTYYIFLKHSGTFILNQYKPPHITPHIVASKLTTTLVT